MTQRTPFKMQNMTKFWEDIETMTQGIKTKSFQLEAFITYMKTFNREDIKIIHNQLHLWLLPRSQALRLIREGKTNFDPELEI